LNNAAVLGEVPAEIPLGAKGIRAGGRVEEAILGAGLLYRTH